MTNQVNEHLNANLQRGDDTPQIIEGYVNPNGSGKDNWSRVVDPLESCPFCGFAQGAHDAAGNCPTETQAHEWYGR